MKKTTIGKLKDGAKFTLALRPRATYKLISKKKGQCTYTSLNSDLSFTRPNTTPCYV